MKSPRPPAAVFLSAVLSLNGFGCASTDPTASGDGQPSAAKACFNVRDVLSFDALHDKFVYVRCRRGLHFLLTMENICLGLRNSLAIEIANDFNRVCSQDRATITYEGLGRTSGCLIVWVEQVEDRAAAQTLVERRTSPTTDAQE
jgi:hypothetical protein